MSCIKRAFAFILSFLFVLIACLSAQTGLAANAQTTQHLIVIFKPNPLFKDFNLAPGEKITAQIEVKNISGQSQAISLQAVNVDDPDHLANVLNLTINHHSDILFHNSLTNFFQAGKIFLSELSDQASATYLLTVEFNESSGNQWQSKKLNNFDIIVGFMPSPNQTPNTIPANNSTGGGGPTRSLTISQENILSLTSSQATISWLTNQPATGRIVYSAQNENHLFNWTKPPNYGYAHSLPGQTAKVTFHTLTLTNLAAGTTYYYRLISAASPPTISREFSFNTPNPTSTPLSSTNQPNYQTNTKPTTGSALLPANNIFSGNDLSPTAKRLIKTSGVVAGEKTTSTADKDNLLITANNYNLSKNTPQFKKTNWQNWLLKIFIILLAGVIFNHLRQIIKKIKSSKKP